MMTFRTPLEFLRLRRTLALWLTLAAPLLAAAMTGLIASRQPADGWGPFFQSMAALWTWFVLPTSAAALSALIAQIEHGPRMWDHLLALPISRSRIYLGKAVLMFALTALMTFMLLPLGLIAGMALVALAPGHAPTGPIPWPGLLALTGLIAAASLTMSVLQIWVALRFTSFIPPLALGLAATFAVVAGMGAPELNWLPWAAPLNVMGLGQASPPVALCVGTVLGIPMLALMTADLVQRER